MTSGNGPAFYPAGNIDAYLNLTPRAAARTSGARGPTTTIIATAAVIAAGIGVWLVVQRRSRRMLEKESV